MPRFGKVEGQEYQASANSKLIWVEFTRTGCLYERSIPHNLKRIPRRVRVLQIMGAGSFSDLSTGHYPTTQPMVYATRVALNSTKTTSGQAVLPGFTTFVGLAGVVGANLFDGDVATTGFTTDISCAATRLDLFCGIAGTVSIVKIRIHATATVAGVDQWQIYAMPQSLASYRLPCSYIVEINTSSAPGWTDINLGYTGSAQISMQYLGCTTGCQNKYNEIEFFLADSASLVERTGSEINRSLGHDATNLYLQATAPCIALLEVV